MLAVDLIAETKLAASKGEARRKIEEGAFNFGPDRTKPTDVKATVPVTDGLVIRLAAEDPARTPLRESQAPGHNPAKIAPVMRA